MRRLLFPLILCGVLALNVSCLEGLETEKTPQAAITSFVIGYYNVKFHDINYHRRDTVINVRENGALYPMTIDQLNNRIFNVDSLAFGSCVNAVTTSVSATGTVVYRYKDDPDGLAYLWTSSDSIDFTRPIVFSALSSDGKFNRDYEVKLNIRTVFPDSLLWSSAWGTGFTALDKPGAAILGDTLYMLGLDTDGNLKMECRNVESGSWSQSVVTGMPADGWSRTLVSFAGRLYSQSGTTVYSSANGTDWSESKTGVKSLIWSGDNTDRIWAAGTDGNIICTTDMTEWIVKGQVPAGFPDSAAISMSYPLATNASIIRTVVVGRGTDSEYSSVWTILSVDSVWSQIDMPAKKDLRLPLIENCALIRYDGSLFAFGAGLNEFRQSNDNGITWYLCDRYAEDYSSWNRYMQFPKALKGYEGAFTFAVDRFETIWIMTTDGQVWRGAITRLDKRGK